MKPGPPALAGKRYHCPGATGHATRRGFRRCGFYGTLAFRPSTEVSMPKKVQLTVALSDYDHFRDFTGGKVEAEGIEITHIDLPVEEIFSRFTRFREWHVSEMSMARYVSLISQGERGFAGIPVFPSRFFRQHAIYVASDRPIERPQDLKGRKVGIPEWVQTALVWVRAYLMHQAGLALTDIDWYQAGVNVGGHVDEVKAVLPKGLRYTPVKEKSLTDLLLAGEIDAMICARPPRLFEEGDKRIRRMFQDFRPVEEQYWRETGIFPIMHTIVLRRDMFEAHPWIGLNLFKAFEEAKRRSLVRALDGNICRFPIPWCFDYAEKSRQMFGQDFWPYGVDANRKTLEAFTQYAFEQGVAHRKLALDELYPEQVARLYEV
jgi:4,5-dihydroxyphthalate decarboxylase